MPFGFTMIDEGERLHIAKIHVESVTILNKAKLLRDSEIYAYKLYCY